MGGFRAPVVVLLGVFIAICSLLVACGVTESTGTAAVANASPTETAVVSTVVVSKVVVSTVVVTGTSGTAEALPSITASPNTSTGTPDASGKVTLILDKTFYTPGGTVMVTIENGLSTKIVVTDHHTDCTYVQLEQLVSGQWQPVGECKLMTPTRLVELAAGSATPQKIALPAGSQATGSYRVALTYSNTTVYSMEFTVA
jgi:hypothetical protein